MSLDLKKFKDNGKYKYEFLKTAINMAQKRFGNESDDSFSFQEQNGYVNLLGVRGLKNGVVVPDTRKSYDDTMFVIYKRSGTDYAKEFEVSTQYGSLGYRHLALAQHEYVLNFHHFNSPHKHLKNCNSYPVGKKYRALRPTSGGVTVFQDTDGDLIQDAGEGDDTSTAHNIHAGNLSSPWGSTQGCQVIRGWSNYKNFIRLVESDLSIIGTKDNELASPSTDNGTRTVIYTLVESAFLEKAPSLPLDLGDGFSVNGESVEKYYAHTENVHKGGYFPLGTNTVWHGGVHLHSTVGSKVAACAMGKIVAARLPDKPDLAVGHYGSRNFILVKHEIADKEFFSLYMHLRNETLSADNDSLKDIAWIKKKTAKTAKYEILIDNMNYRSAPVANSDTLLGQLSKNEIVKVVDKSQDPWVKVRREGDTRDVYIYHKSTWQKEIQDYEVDTELLGQLGKGDIVKLDKTVNPGELLWTVGEYGSESYRTGLLHWEVFSEKNLFPKWKSVEDSDSDFNVDSEKIISMVDQDGGWFSSDKILTSDELERFYKSDQDAKKLRRYACKFMIEWGVDLDVAIPKMKERWFTSHLKERISPYLWWDEAQSAGVPLPSGKHVWHYNSIGFIEAMYNMELE